MSAKIDISPEQLDIVQAILRAHLPKGTRAWAFGSRVTWTAKPYSDLDLAVEAAAPLPLEVMGDLQEAFENSDLPWRVDVIDLKSVSPEFRAIVERQRVPADWRTTTLGDEVEELTVGHVGSMADEYTPTGVPFLRSLNVVPYGVSKDEMRFISLDFHKRLKKSALKPGDVVIVRTGKPGTCTVIPDWLPDANCSDLVIARCAPSLRPRFLAYWVNAMATHHIGSSLVGAVQQHFNVGAARKMPLFLPQVGEQDQILAVLGTLDDKIELNRQMNQTLEALARAVFEDWFVGFGPTRRKMAGETDPAAILGGLLPPETASPLATLFPDSFGDNGLPLGWEPKSLGDVVEPRKGRNITKKTVAHGTVPVVAGGLSPAYYHDTANVSGPVITASASGANAGFVRLYNQDIWASDCSYISREQTEYLFTIYALLSSRQDEIYSMQQGAAQPHVYPSDLKRLAIADAPPPIWQACEELLSPMFEQLASNEQENQTLAATRDLLLPKLMSGELRLVPGEAVE